MLSPNGHEGERGSLVLGFHQVIPQSLLRRVRMTAEELQAILKNPDMTDADIEEVPAEFYNKL